MKTFWIAGGLGNQMFQYAYALSFKEQMYFDLSWYNRQPLFPLLIDKAFGLDLPVAKVREDYLKGYWQGERYFEDVTDTVRNTFRFKDDFTFPVDSTPVSIHIRRTDRVSDNQTNAIYGVCSKAYFERAMDYIRKKVKNPLFVIISDDIIWAKKEFPNEFCIHHGYPVMDMMVMSKCDHNIISNSTFSWWGAWLNNNHNKIVIAPKRWYRDRDEGDLIPKGWVRL